MEKLVRDLIPAIIIESGKMPKYRVAERGHELQTLVVNKLKEEIDELVEEIDDDAIGNVLEELADVYEVLGKIEQIFDIDHSDVVEMQKTKAYTNGAFQHNYVLTLGPK